MKSDCILIATLPSLNNSVKVEAIFKNECISEVRFNTGVQTPYSVEETLSILKNLSIKYNKKLWIDLKGRQLRVAKWADPLYSCIELNHKVEVKYPAQICFRNGDRVNITHIKEGNKVFVDPLPRQALGAGQSVNILASEVNIDGYLTPKDIEYLEGCKKTGIMDVMLSFVEKTEDVLQVYNNLPGANIVLKIESLKGIDYILGFKFGMKGLSLMAARDDLYIETGQNYKMLKFLKHIISKDKNAICASKIFTSLEKRGNVDFADFADLELMYELGYRRFMLCDNVCNYSFDKAVNAWKEFVNG